MHKQLSLLLPPCTPLPPTHLPTHLPTQPPTLHCPRHYSANLMRLALYGRESLDELEAMVRSAFSAVQNKQLPQPEFPPDVYTTEVW